MKQLTKKQKEVAQMILRIKKILQLISSSFAFSGGSFNFDDTQVRFYIRLNYGNQAFLYENDNENETENEVAVTFYELWQLHLELNQENLNRMFETLYAEYNPIENYNKHEIETILTEKENDTDTTAYGSNTEKVDGEYLTNTSIQTYENGYKDETSVQRGHAEGAKDTTKESGNTSLTKTFGDKNETRENNTSGNIGTMSTQNMIQQEYEIRKINLFNEFIDSFIRKYCFTYWGDRNDCDFL